MILQLAIGLLFIGGLAQGADLVSGPTAKAGQDCSVVKFHEEFNPLNFAEWRIDGYREGVSVKDGILRLATPGTDAKVIRMTSNRKFRYAVLKARIRLSAIGKPTNHYIGFITRDGWDDADRRQSVWLMDSCVNRFEMWWGKGSELGGTMISPEIQVNKWYDIEIRWTNEQVEFSVDGIMIGVSTKAIPDMPMPVVVDLFSSDEAPVTMEIDFLDVKQCE